MLYTKTTAIALRELDVPACNGGNYVVELYDLHDNAIEIRHCHDREGLRRAVAPYVIDADMAIDRLLENQAQ